MSYTSTRASGESVPPTPKSHRRKRQSVANEYRIFKQSHDEVLEELQVTWDQMGLSEDDQGIRMHQFYEHLNSLLQDMAGEEKILLETLKKKIAKSLPFIQNLRKELGLEEYDIALQSIPLFEAEGVLRTEKQSLEAEKSRRLELLGELKGQDQQLCNELEQETYFVSIRAIPSLLQLDELENHVLRARKEKESRLLEYKREYKQIVSWARKLEFVPKSDFETMLFTCSSAEFQLSSSNMRLLNALFEKLSQKYEEYLDTLRIKIHSLKDELSDLWDKCFATDQQRHALPHFDEENYSDQAYEAYKNEVGRWKHFYDSRQAVLATVQRWETLWKEKTDFEYKRDHDPNRFNTRGGNLERELKRHRQIEVTLLPRVVGEVEEAARVWDAENPNDPIILGGLPPLNYLQNIQNEYKEKMEREKIEKAKLKQKQLVNETRFGTPRQGLHTLKPSTPSAGVLGRCASPGSRAITSRVASPVLRSGTPSRSRLTPAASAPRMAAMRSPTRSRPPIPPRQNMQEAKGKPPPIPLKRRLQDDSLDVDYKEFKNNLLQGDEEKLLNSTHVELNPSKRRC